MSFILTNAPAPFTDLMNKVFKECVELFGIIIIYYILIYSWNVDEHVTNFRFVMRTLKVHKLLIKFRKF